MYDYVKGILTSKFNNSKGIFLTVEAGGIGYIFEVTERDYNIAALDNEIKIYCVLLHREDKMSLCGFIKKEDRDLFNVLTSVSGVGSKMALTLLNEFNTAELIGLVIDGNFKSLTSAKGVGPKLAQKIILELKDKLSDYQIERPIRVSSTIKIDNEAINDAQSVLTSLGYDTKEITSAISRINPNDSKSAEDILKECLKYLSV
jgi:Holliday junction DNA helicase RuvA